MSAESPASAAEIDAVGLRCPEPVMMLHAAMRRIAPGEVVHLVATDPSTERDVANFCRFLNHDLLSATSHDGRYDYLIRKAGA
jgi:tRNA 2-thiouridine synthesizing protein A